MILGKNVILTINVMLTNHIILTNNMIQVKCMILASMSFEPIMSCWLLQPDCEEKNCRLQNYIPVLMIISTDYL